MPPPLVHALCQAGGSGNQYCTGARSVLVRVIAVAAPEVIEGKLDDHHFPLVVWQTGSHSIKHECQ